MFNVSAITFKENLVHFALVAEAESVEFECAIRDANWLKAMPEEINSIENNQTWVLVENGDTSSKLKM